MVAIRNMLYNIFIFINFKWNNLVNKFIPCDIVITDTQIKILAIIWMCGHVLAGTKKTWPWPRA